MFCRLLLALWLGVLAVNRGATENLIRNASLEDADPQNPAAPLGFGLNIRPGANNADRKYQWVEAGRASAKAFKSELQGEAAALAPSLKVEALEPGTLYRFSVWYRTEGPAPEPRALMLQVDPYGYWPIYYPTAVSWTQARLFFLCRTNSNGQVAPPRPGVYLNAYRGGTPAYVKDPQGRLVRDAQGRQLVTNGIPLTVYLDDFELRQAAPEEYRGNLVDNPGFEQGAPGAWPPGWCPYYETAGAIDDAEHHSGAQSLRLDCLKTTETCRTYFWFTEACVPARADDICTFSLWVKCSKPGTVMHWREHKRGPLKTFTLGAGWEQLVHSFFISKTPRQDEDKEFYVAAIDIALDAPEDCRVWLDDAEFVIETLK